jgi:hypothetical protein
VEYAGAEFFRAISSTLLSGHNFSIVRTTLCAGRCLGKWSIKRMVQRYGQCLVAIYPSRSDAERAHEAVIRSGK